MNDRNRRIARPSFAAAGLALACLLTAPARADVIDGDWCRGDGRTMSIRGPQIVTPGGKTIQGDYTRHSFAYVIPAGEAGEGESVSMICATSISSRAAGKRRCAAAGMAALLAEGELTGGTRPIRSPGDREVTQTCSSLRPPRGGRKLEPTQPLPSFVSH